MDRGAWRSCKESDTTEQPNNKNGAVSWATHACRPGVWTVRAEMCLRPWDQPGAGGTLGHGLPHSASSVPTDLFLGGPATEPHGAGEDAFPGRERRQAQEPDGLHRLHGQRGSLQRGGGRAAEHPHPGPDPASRWGRLEGRVGRRGGPPGAWAHGRAEAAEQSGWVPRPHGMPSIEREHSPPRGAQTCGLRRDALGLPWWFRVHDSMLPIQGA